MEHKKPLFEKTPIVWAGTLALVCAGIYIVNHPPEQEKS